MRKLGIVVGMTVSKFQRTINDQIRNPANHDTIMFYFKLPVDQISENKSCLIRIRIFFWFIIKKIGTSFHRKFQKRSNGRNLQQRNPSLE